MENTPQLDGNGEYVDTKGRIWTTFMGMGPKLGIDPTTISNNMSPAAAVLDGLNTVGSPAPLHLKEEIRRAVRHLLNIPKKRDVTGTGIYTTKSGKQYATAPAAARHFGLQAASTIHNIAARTKVEILQGRDEQGVVILFSLDDLARDPTIQARLNGQIRVDKNGYYTDNEGIVWATVNAFYDNLPKEIKEKTDKSAVWNQAKKYCQSKSAIDRGGRPNAEIFRIDELETKALALAKEDFRVDKNTGYYSEKDEQGNEIMRWATKNVWLDLLKVTRFALKKGLEKTFRNWDKVLRRRGLSQNGKPDWLYSEKIIKEILAYIFEAKIQFENGTYVQEITNKVYRTAVALGKEAKVTAANVKRRLLKANCTIVRGVDCHSGADEELFDYEVFRQVFGGKLIVILWTDIEGIFTDREHGRCLTVGHFCSENPNIPRKRIDRLLRRRPDIVKLRRKSRITNRLETLYPDKVLKTLAGKS